MQGAWSKPRQHLAQPNKRFNEQNSSCTSVFSKLCLLYRHGCFTGKYNTRKIHKKLHPGPEWCIFHILTSEDIDHVISRFFSGACAKSKMARSRFVKFSKDDVKSIWNVRTMAEATRAGQVDKEMLKKQGGGMDELGSSQSGGTERECWSESVTALCAYWRDGT